MSWEDVKNSTTGNNNSTSGSSINYLKLETGANQIRVIGDQPYSRWYHWIPEANGGRGLGIDCIGKECPVCKKMAEDKKNKVKTRYSSRKIHSISVIHRKPDGTSELALLEQGNKIFSGLLVLMEQMGDLKNYDVKIIKSGQTFNEIDYNVLPVFPPTPLTEQEAQIEPYTEDQIKKVFTKEQIIALMNGATLEQVLNPNDETTAANQSPSDEADVDFTQRA
jgi:hypothetical protein